MNRPTRNTPGWIPHSTLRKCLATHAVPAIFYVRPLTKAPFLNNGAFLFQKTNRVVESAANFIEDYQLTPTRQRGAAGDGSASECQGDAC
jgi:hypothetical protein